MRGRLHGPECVAPHIFFSTVESLVLATAVPEGERNMRQSVDENGATSVANIMQGKFFLSSGLLDHAGAKVQAVRGRQEYNEGSMRTLAGLPYTMVESLLQVLPWDNIERDSGGVRFLITTTCLCMMALTASYPFSSIFMTRGQSCHPRRMGPRPWTKPPDAPSSRCALAHAHQPCSTMIS